MQSSLLNIEFQSTPRSVTRFWYFLAARLLLLFVFCFFVLPFPVTLPGVIKKLFLDICLPCEAPK